MNDPQEKRLVSIVIPILLVVACLAILAGLLLPALSKAKARAHGGGGLRFLAEDLSSPAEVQISPTFNTESYAHLVDNPFLGALDNPLSTFAIDVDTASYSITRRFLNERQLPPKDAVRIEELLNYFSYSYPPPAGEQPFSASVEVAGCPWNDGHRLVRIGLQGREIPPGRRPPANLVFLIDVSGSMEPANKLPLIKKALAELVENLTAEDRVTLVVYAGNSGLVLPPTPGNQKAKILAALRRLEAGGSTNGGEGIEQAYRSATANFIKGGANRVILCTDGDFNVGITSPGELIRLIGAKAKSGVYLTVLGFGMDNYKDSTAESLADKGNGNYAYIDTIQEARKVLVDQMSATLITIAKDVKIQIEFNPARVQSWRLLGYENRLLRKEDFNDDQKDAGEIGAGHTVTALYEIVPTGRHARPIQPASVDPLKFQRPPEASAAAASDELLHLKLRYKDPEGGDVSKLVEIRAADGGSALADASIDFRFASAVAAFGMLLRDSEHKGSATFDMVRQLASGSKGTDQHGYRGEFIELVAQAAALTQAR